MTPTQMKYTNNVCDMMQDASMLMIVNVHCVGLEPFQTVQQDFFDVVDQS